MFLSVLPLQLIWFQFFFLLIAISLESYVLQARLSFGRKKSVFYAASINLISAFFGWLFFFLMVPILPVSFKAQIISFIFFDKFFLDGEMVQFSAESWFTLAAIFMFFASLTIKMRSFLLLQLFLNPPKLQEEAAKQHSLLSGQTRPPSLADKAKSVLNILIFGTPKRQKKNLVYRKGSSISVQLSRRKALALLWGHAGSNSVILAILLIRNLGFYYRERNN